MPPKQPQRQNSYFTNLLWKKPNDAANGDADTKSLLSKASKADTKQLVSELQAKLDETTAALDAKTRTVDTLEDRVRTLASSLETTQAESRDASAALQTAEDAKAKLQTDLAETLRRSDAGRHEHAEQSAQLEVARRQVDETKSALETERAAHLSVEQRLKSTEEDRDKLTTQHEKNREVISAKDVELQDGIRRLQTLASELSAVRDERNEQSDRAADLQLELSIVTKERAELDQRCEDYLRRMKTLEADLGKKSSVMDEMTETLEAKYADLQAAREELDATRVESARRSMQIEELAAELAQTSDSLDQTRAQARADADTHLRKLDELERRHSQSYAELERQVDRLTVELQAQEESHERELQATHASHRDEIDTLAAERDEVQRRCDVAGRELEGFREEYDRVLIDAEALKAQCDEQESTIQDLQTELSEAEGALASALRALDAAKVQLEEGRQRTAEIERAKGEVIEGLSADLSHAREAHAALRETFLATDRHAKELENTARALQDEIRQLHAAHQDELSDLLVDKADMQRKVDAAYVRASELDQMVQADGAKITQLESECDQAKARITQLNNVLKGTEEAYAECRAALSQSSHRLKALQAESDAIRQKSAASEREKEQAVARLSSELSQASQQNKTLQAELDAARQRLSGIGEKDQEIARLYQEIARLSKELADVREARNALTRKLNSSNEQARRQLQQAEESTRKRTDEVKQLRTTHQAAVDELHGKHRSALQQQVKQSLQEIEKRDAELRAVRSDLAAATAARASAEQEVNTLKTTLENHKHSAGSLERTKDGIAVQIHNDYKAQIAALVAEKEELMHRWNVQVRELKAEQVQLLLAARRHDRVGRGVVGGIAAALGLATGFLL
ncbi:hypothetical protein EVJ58_g123 [Rhodofomes roseus]|uniref:Uncharacterized protein n=1 Tax=Rhodofomes roseus TaxID=34475 RepID=A0A4Y9Z5D3_9APHY|nr:hypothetical protein EVJ58_g123 [Rhodofomes roseus]